MYSETRIMLAVGCAGLLAMSVPAFSLPASKDTVQHAAQKQKIMPRTAKINVGKKNVTKNNAGKKPIGVQARTRAPVERHAARLVSMPVAEPLKRPMFGWPVLVREARQYIGTNPTARSRLWCATFMNLVLAKAGYAGTNSDAARSFTDYGHRIPGPEIGAIAVLARGKHGGHVGVVTGIDPHGNPIIISGNHGHRVGEGIYSRSRVIAYVMPSERGPGSVTQLASRVTLSSPNTPNHPPAGPIIDSPIAELIAAIEAEQKRSEAKAGATRPADVPVPPRAVPQIAEDPTPHRVVQQLPEQPQRMNQTPPQPMRQPPQRLQRPRPGRVASADIRPSHLR